MNTSLNGKTFVVTGATSGIGQAVAEGLARGGASVIGVGRNPERCAQTEEQLRLLHADGGQIAVCTADLSTQTKVRALAHEIYERISGCGKSSIDGLVNNAGTVPFWQTLTPEGFDTQWAVNHLAAFLLTQELLPLLKAAPASRVVTVSSGSHYNTHLKWEDIQLRRHYNPLTAYKQTKLANVLFTAELNRRMGAGSNVRAFAADPGLVNTEIGFKSNSILERWAWNIRRRSGIPAEEAAKGIVFLLTEPTIQHSTEIYWKHGKPKAPDAYALNPEAAKQLWELSSQMCGINTNKAVR